MVQQITVRFQVSAPAAPRLAWHLGAKIAGTKKPGARQAHQVPCAGASKVQGCRACLLVGTQLLLAKRCIAVRGKGACAPASARIEAGSCLMQTAGFGVDAATFAQSAL